MSEAYHGKEDGPEPLKDRQGWMDGGKIEIFDRRIKKNELAAEERRLRANSKKSSQKADVLS